MTYTHLSFNTAISKNKPENIRNKNTPCPFCAREELTDIIDVDEPIILLKNKYPVLEEAYQTVIIETNECSSELSLYSDEHLIKLLTFGMRHWIEMEESGEFKSVLFFKNHGPLSGGSIAHPHMQIVGLNTINYRKNISKVHFEGLTIDETEGVVFSLSTKPKVGFYEFNVKMTEFKQIPHFARYLQTAVRFILNHFHYKCNSYNLFFYRYGPEIYVKIIPRFITNPLYIGYSIPQIPANLEHVKDSIRNKYFN